jgi:tRNA(fMet)-specific endonuclease VapC
MTYVLDTNTISGFMRGHPAIVAHVEATPRLAIRVPQPVLPEIAYGLARLPRSKRKDDLVGLFRLIRQGFPRALWDDMVTDHYGRAKALLESRGERIEDFDVAVAAHALAADAVLVTANQQHMARIPGLRIEDWSA